jgi:hypothetical protein
MHVHKPGTQVWPATYEVGVAPSAGLNTQFFDRYHPSLYGDVRSAMPTRAAEASVTAADVHERILSYYNQLSYAEWLEKADTAGWPSVLHEMRSLRPGDCTMYSSLGQIVDWNDLHKFPGDTCGCVEGMRGFDSTSYDVRECYERCDGLKGLEREFVFYVGS